VPCFPNVTTFAKNKTREQAGVAGRKKKGITWPMIFRHITLLINGSLQEFKPVLLSECPQQDWTENKILYPCKHREHDIVQQVT
jgi:hypothetical protein